ncbi:MAG: HAMP domain-containing histidine kinase [Hydrococcus sp. Prado102]|jgi:signal transduction histidine kinase|nr:HAMP domain-containing histidine kinase [Hydrococcus sp. Prado102]
MALLKRLTSWIVASNQISIKGFPDLGWRLLIAYLTAVAAILGTSATTLYIFFERNLNERLNRQLLALAQAAIPSLEMVKIEGRQNLDKDLPWRHLFSDREQGLEWFDSDGNLLTKEGTLVPKTSSIAIFLSSRSTKNIPIFEQERQIRSVTIAVYTSEANKNILQLKGYIRASESTRHYSATLARLRLKLWMAGIIALFLISLSSIYLARQALVPSTNTLERLKHLTAEASLELRNPLARIAVASDVMLAHAEQFQPSDARKLEMISTAAKQMKRLLEELLFLVRTNIGVLAHEMERSPLSLTNLLQELAEHFDPIAQIKGIVLRAELKTEITVKGDATQLNRLFSNLIGNAIKYTDSGGKVTVSGETLRGWACISVEDTGYGIAPEALPFVFQRFWRSKDPKARQQEGLGLGLAIGQAIAQQHGGKITVESQLGVGSCFRVHLPLG